MNHTVSSLKSLSINATLHCLTGCAIGEITGMVLGVFFGWPMLATMIVAILLAFIFGYSLSMLPLLRSGLPFKKALPIILAADTLSILTMEIVDNGVMAIIPGAMNAGLVNPIFWLSMSVALSTAFIAAVPVNYYLLKRGKGHALVHQHHEHHHSQHEAHS